MEEILYSKEHYWVHIENDIATIGLADYFLNSLEEIQSIELPQVRTLCNKTDVIGSIFCDEEEISICSIFTGEIIDINEIALEDFEQIRNSPYSDSWLYRIAINNENEISELISEEEYEQYIDEILNENTY